MLTPPTQCSMFIDIPITWQAVQAYWHSYWRAVSTKRKPFDQPSSGHQQRTDVKAGLLRCMASEMTVTRHRVGMIGFNVPPNLLQGDHSPDNVKFPDNSMTFPWRFTALLPMSSVIMPVLVFCQSWGRNATVYDPKIKWNAQAQQSQEWTQICS